MTKCIAIMSAVLLSFSVATPAAAHTETTCFRHSDIVLRLLDVHGEKLVATGIAANGQPIETYANLVTGTWTTVVRFSDIVSCLMATGTKFRSSIGDPA